MKSVIFKPKQVLLIVLLIIIRGTILSFAQKAHFVPITVSDGLPQSQATSFMEDKNGQLLIGTVGGLGIYDGNKIKKLDKTNGLFSNSIYQIKKGKDETIYLGHLHGITKIKNNQITKYPLKQKNALIHSMEIDSDGNVWVLSNGRALILKNDLDTFQNINDYFVEYEQELKEDLIFIDLELMEDGRVLLLSVQKGPLVWENKKLKLLDENKNNWQGLVQRIFVQNEKIYFSNLKVLYVLENGMLEPIPLPDFRKEEYILNFHSNNKGDYWLATSRGGIYFYHNKKWNYYNKNNGFTSENIFNIYEDQRGTYWFGSNGAGVFSYKDQSIVYFDESSGLNSASIAAIQQDKNGNIIAASSNNGFFVLTEEGNFKEVFYNRQSIRVFSMVKTTSGNVLIGTSLHGLMSWNGNTLSQIDNSLFTITSLFYFQQSLFLNRVNYFQKWKNNTVEDLNFNHNIQAIDSFSSSELLLGTSNGLFIYNTNKNEGALFEPFKNLNVIDLAQDEDYIYIGSLEDGLFQYNKNDKTVKRITTSNGLSCNSVYSLLIDHKNTLWIGTGCGVDVIIGNEIINKSKAWNLGEVELNSGVLFEDKDKNIWIGTNQKLFKYNPHEEHAIESLLPKLMFESIQLSSKTLSASKLNLEPIDGTDFPKEPIFLPKENHLTFEFKAVQLPKLENVKYRYKLEGIDDGYTETQQHLVSYPNLPSGKYTFKVWLVVGNKEYIESAISYKFTINAPIWKNTYFGIAIALFSIAITFAIMYYINKWKNHRLIWQQEIREEEQAKIREKTAEDFHDEIGNKLTRIKLLTNIAKMHISEENEKVQNIMQQIGENVQLLFSGSKDIIWSLQSESDYLNEILRKIHQNIVETIEGSNIKLTTNIFDSEEKSISLPLQWSRNIVLIFKEATNNAVKHASPTELIWNFKENDAYYILSLEDNGIGITEHDIQGNGLKNMENRAKRIQAKLIIEDLPKGTRVHLYLNKNKI